jgi:hypothetical protein
MAAVPAPPLLVVDTADTFVVAAMSTEGLGAASSVAEELKTKTPFPKAIESPIANTATVTPPVVNFFVREDLPSPTVCVLFFIARDPSITGCKNRNVTIAAGRTTVC